MLVAGTKKRRSYRTKKRVKEWLSLQYRNIDYRDETLGSGTAPKFLVLFFKKELLPSPFFASVMN
jgi:hypothetical protein